MRLIQNVTNLQVEKPIPKYDTYYDRSKKNLIESVCNPYLIYMYANQP